MSKQHRSADQMANKQYRQIGRGVVSAVVMNFLPAHLAGIYGLQIGTKQFAFVAMGAAAPKTAFGSLPPVTRLLGFGILSINRIVCVGHPGLRGSPLPFMWLSCALAGRGLVVAPPASGLFGRSRCACAMRTFAQHFEPQSACKGRSFDEFHTDMIA